MNLHAFWRHPGVRDSCTLRIYILWLWKRQNLKLVTLNHVHTKSHFHILEPTVCIMIDCKTLLFPAASIRSIRVAEGGTLSGTCKLYLFYALYLIIFNSHLEQTGVAIETHSQTIGTKHHAVWGLLSMPPSLKQSERRGLFFVNSLVVDLTFEQSKNVTIAVMSCSWLVSRSNRFEVLAAFICACTLYTNGWSTS